MDRGEVSVSRVCGCERLLGGKWGWDGFSSLRCYVGILALLVAMRMRGALTMIGSLDCEVVFCVRYNRMSFTCGQCDTS